MASTNPLAWNVPIVDANGRPTAEFMRKWQAQTSINSSIPSLSTATAVSLVLDVICNVQNSILIRGATQWGYITAPNDATKFLNGAASPVWAKVKDSDLNITDNTTNNVSTAAHGFVPKAPGGTTKFLREDGSWAVPAGGSIGDSTTVIGTYDLSTYTLDAGNEIILTNVDVYDEVKLIVIKTAVSSASRIAVRLSTDNGSTWKSGASDYIRSLFDYSTQSLGGATSELTLENYASTGGVGGIMKLYQLGNSTVRTFMESVGEEGARVRQVIGFRDLAEVNNALKVFCIEGNAFTSGMVVAVGTTYG